MDTYTYKYACICTYTYKHIYVCICTYMNIYIYIYRICTSCSEREANVYADVHNICLTYISAHAWRSTSFVHACRLKCIWTRACAPMQRCSSFFVMEAVANLTSARFKNPSKSTLAHDAVTAVVLHKDHLIICVGAGLIQFVYGSRSHLANGGYMSQKCIFAIFVRVCFLYYLCPLFFLMSTAQFTTHTLQAAEHEKNCNNRRFLVKGGVNFQGGWGTN